MSSSLHEQVLPGLRRAGIPVRWTDLTVRHTGYVDMKILQTELTERHHDPFILFNLGAIAIEEKTGQARWPL